MDGKGRTTGGVCRNAWKLRGLSIAASLIFLMAAGIPGFEVRLGFAQPAPAIIDNGTVQLGINPEGHLNVPGGTAAMEVGTTVVGLRYIPTNGEATGPGCLCEGWGVANADPLDQFAGYANIASDGGVVGLIVEPGTGVTVPTGQINAESVGSAFKSIVKTFDASGAERLRVTHDYHPSSSSNLYKVDVTIENISATPISDLRYRRVMDWDIAPFTFSEWVEIHVGTATNLIRATTDGFNSANPLSIFAPSVGSPPTTLVPGSTDYFSGPSDQGALFDFSFGPLSAGGSITFTIYYGAAASRTEALTAISSVGAEVYSLGLPRTATNEASVDGPHAFIFAFSGVGGTPVPPPEPDAVPIITTVREGLIFPVGVAVEGDCSSVDVACEVYIADRNAHKVYKIGTSPNDVIVVAGTGEAGYNGDGIQATAAQLNGPSGVALANGNLLIADSDNHIIRSVNLSNGTITTIAGIPKTLGVAVNGGPATAATLFSPRGVAADAAGNVYIVDNMNHQVRMVDASTGFISAAAGVGVPDNIDGPVSCAPLAVECTPAALNSPLAVALGSLFIADEGNDSIRMVVATEGGPEVQTVDTGEFALDSPSGVAFDAANSILYVANTDTNQILSVSDGGVTIVAGTGTAGFSGDNGPAAAAQLNAPVGIALDATGRFLYIADRDNSRIRRVDFNPPEQQ